MVKNTKPKRNYKKTGKVSSNVKNYVNKVINKDVETKQWIQTLTGGTVGMTTISNAWVEFDATALAQAVNSSGRIGQEIRLKSFYMNGALHGGQSNTAADDAHNTVRFVLALWDGRAATPLATNGALIDSHIVSTNPPGRGLIKKYMDFSVDLVSPGVDSAGYITAMKRIKKFVKLNNHKITFYQDGVNIGNQRLILSAISDSAVVPHVGFQNGFCSIAYTDA